MFYDRIPTMSKLKLEAPSVILEKIAAANNLNSESVEFANCLDERDELREYRCVNRFVIDIDHHAIWGGLLSKLLWGNVFSAPIKP